MSCKFCDQEATGFTLPPMCESHLDLAILCEFLVRQSKPVTPEMVKETYRLAIENGGQFVISEADIDLMMQGEFTQRYEVMV